MIVVFTLNNISQLTQNPLLSSVFTYHKISNRNHKFFRPFRRENITKDPMYNRIKLFNGVAKLLRGSAVYFSSEFKFKC